MVWKDVMHVEAIGFLVARVALEVRDDLTRYD